jgi:putative transposase
VFQRRPRLRTFDYTGLYRVFLTFCTCGRSAFFIDADPVALVWGQILRTAEAEGVEISAHCFMPDHVHLLVESRRTDSDIRRFVHQAKQRSGYEFSRRFRQKLWQPSWYDRVLREDEETPRVVRYILENPVRAGLVESYEQYPFCGSLVYPQDLIKAWIEELESWEQP